jgi:hypothetical protein
MENLKQELEEALHEVRKAEVGGDRERAAALFEAIADLAGRLSEEMSGELAGEGAAAEIGDDETFTAGLLPGEEPVPGAGAGERTTPSALVWKTTERDMRVFFYRTLPEVFDAFRERYGSARERGDREKQCAVFRELGDLMTVLVNLKVPRAGGKVMS